MKFNHSAVYLSFQDQPIKVYLLKCPECDSIFSISHLSERMSGKYNPLGKYSCNWCGCVLPIGYFTSEMDKREPQKLRDIYELSINTFINITIINEYDDYLSNREEKKQEIRLDTKLLIENV